MSQLHSRVNFPLWAPIALSGVLWGIFRIVVNLDVVLVGDGRIDTKIMSWVANAFLVATGFKDSSYLPTLFTAFFLFALGISLSRNDRIVLWKKRSRRPQVLDPDKLEELHRILKGK